MDGATKLVARVSRWFAWGGGALILASAVVITLDVIVRAVFNSTYFESFELSGYAFAIATSFGLAYALVSKAHIRIEVVYTRLGLKSRAILDVFAFSSLSAISLVLAYWCLQTVLQNGEMGARSNSTLAVPLAIPQAAWFFGLGWFAVVSTVFAICGAAWLVRGRIAKVHQTLGVGSLQEEISANVEPARVCRQEPVG